MIVVVGLWIALALVGISILALIISGVKGLITGDLDTKKIISILIPVVVVIVSYLIMGTIMKAGLLAVLVMIALMVLAIFITGARGVFS